MTNLGNTCFVNAVLQILLKCPPVALFFLTDKHNRFECMAHAERRGGDALCNPCLACEMDLLFTQCFSGKQQPVSPHTFLHVLWATAESFAGYEQQDAHEFLTALLAAIDNGIKSSPPMARPAMAVQGYDNKPIVSGSSSSNSNNGTPAELARLFTGILRSDVTCLQCKRKSTKFDEFHDVSIDLSRIVGGGGADDADDSYHSSLAACLKAFTRSERLGFSERCWCTNCNSLQDSAKQLSFHRLPPVLCFHLKRFRHSAQKSVPPTKIEAFIDFPLHSLDMGAHTSQNVCAATAGGSDGSAEPLPERLYDLFGVAEHHGGMSNGHYTAYVRSQAEWFLCDDTLVAPADESSVRNCKAYLLFYVAKRLPVQL